MGKTQDRVFPIPRPVTPAATTTTTTTTRTATTNAALEYKHLQEINNIYLQELKQIEQQALTTYTQHHRTLLRQYGFVADLNKTRRQNILTVLTSYLHDEYLSRPSNLAFHDLTTHAKIPKTTKNLLGLGTKFCIAEDKPNYSWIKTSQERLTRQIRLHAELPPFDEDKPALWCSSDYEPPRADRFTEGNIKLFFRRLKHRIRRYQHRRSPNLTRTQRNILQDLRNNDSIVILNCDKNLGPSVMDRQECIDRVLTEHLLDHTTYRRLTLAEATIARQQARHNIMTFLHNRSREERLTKDDKKFIFRRLDTDLNEAKFYGAPKVHKTPLKLRPIVQCCGTITSGLATWANEQLKHHAIAAKNTISDSRDLLQRLTAIQNEITAHTRFLNSDIDAFYPSIEITKGSKPSTRTFSKTHPIPTPISSAKPSLSS